MTVVDLDTARKQFHPVLAELGYTCGYDGDDSISWQHGEDTELIVFPAREPGGHRHGRAGWQHLAFALDSRGEVDRLHAAAVDAGWAVVREPKLFPRFNERYYASFVEDASGIRVEFMHNPPRESPGD
ncbi:VOC family protein [Arthrobacter stackebrandtii]|nr:VOC family protein [Arthrobacter stackebrandtii]